MTTGYVMIALNPCPFCGGNAKITSLRRGNYSRKGDNYQGLCNKCKARGPLVQDDPQLAADKWNSIEAGWLPIKGAPRDGTNILLRFGQDGVSQGAFVPGLAHPWKFIDTQDGITWLINFAVDGPGGPSHFKRLPE